MSLKELQAELTGMEKYTRRTDEELRQQAEGLYKNQYDQDLRALQDAIGQGIAQQNRSALSAGMQRSSYNQAAQASIRNQGIESQRQLASDYESNVANALYQLIAREDEREDNANAQRNQLLMALYEYGRKGSSGGGGSQNILNDPNANQNVNSSDRFDELMKTVEEQKALQAFKTAALGAVQTINGINSTRKRAVPAQYKSVLDRNILTTR